jgi:hypothetical protein
LTTLAAAFPRLGSRGDRAAVGPELGVEPPIRMGDDRLDRSERRGASVRWLAGATLTGLCGVTLIGAALYLDLDSQYDFAEAPEFAAPTRSADSQEEGVNPAKGDRLLRPVDIIADKQTFKVPTIIKVGDKEVVKARPFTHLQTTLTLTPTGFADAVPPFNPLRLMNRGSDVADPPPDPGPMQDDAEITFRTEDLSPTDAGQITGELSQAEAQAQVIETLKAPADARSIPAAPDPIDANEPSRPRPAWRALRLRHSGQREPERALRVDRSTHDPRERDECGQVNEPRRCVSERETCSNAP